MRNGSLFWGFALLALGVVLLLDNMNLLPPSLNIWAIFWPLMLVLFGMSILLRSVLPGRGLREEPGRVPLGDARRAVVKLYHGAGEIHLDSGAAPDDLLSGTFSGGVDQRVHSSDGELVAELRAPMDSFPVFTPFDAQGGFNWTLGLNPSIPLALELELGASRNILNLSGLQVKELRLQTGASSTELEMPTAAGMTHAVIRSGAAAVVVRVPQGVAANIRAHGGLAAIEIDSNRFPRFGDGYRSADYDSAANRLDIDIETGVGSVSVR